MKWRLKRLPKRSKAQSVGSPLLIPVAQTKPWKDRKLFAPKMKPCTNLHPKRQMILPCSNFRKRRAILAIGSFRWDLVDKMSKIMNFNFSTKRLCFNLNRKRRRKRKLSRLGPQIATKTAATRSIIRQTLLSRKAVRMMRNRSKCSRIILRSPAWDRMSLPCSTTLIICRAMFLEWPQRSTNLRNRTTHPIYELLFRAIRITWTRIHPLADPMFSQEHRTIIRTSGQVDNWRVWMMPSTTSLNPNKRFWDSTAKRKKKTWSNYCRCQVLPTCSKETSLVSRTLTT